MERVPPSQPNASAANAQDDDRTVVASSTPGSLPGPILSGSLPGRMISGVPTAVGQAPARQVGRYQVLERLGEGAMASVYKAFDPNIERTLAIKFMHADLCVDEEYRRRFVREAKAAGSLSHPNIVTVYDVGEIDGRPYMAMELLDGMPLNEFMAVQKTPPIREVLNMGIQLASALDFAHAKGIVHRDIKPGNIMRLKGTSKIKVTDFGIAHIENAESSERTRVGTIIGTPQYMAPEQALGNAVDARSDLFSVGVLLYQLLTGQRPFESESTVTLVYRIAKEEAKPIEALRSDVPASLRRVVERCMRKQPEKRYQSGAELVEALTQVVRELDEDADRKGRPRIIPLRVKWTGMMALVIAITMAVTAAFVTQRISSAMTGHMVDHGASLGKLLATETAVPTLSEDWVTIEVFIQEVLRTQENLKEIAVTDHEGIVRVSGDAKAVGKRYQHTAGTPVPSAVAGIAVQRYRTADGVAVLDFTVPITFQKKPIGQVHLQSLEAPLTKVTRAAIGMLALLVVITVIAVAIATYFIADHFSKPIRLLERSMAEVGKGRYDYRIAEKRTDEFGLAFRAFDAMAQRIQRRHEVPPPADADSSPNSKA
jgi:eukaryotic-like serine/threonine-protein kinase